MVRKHPEITIVPSDVKLSYAETLHFTDAFVNVLGKFYLPAIRKIRARNRGKKIRLISTGSSGSILAAGIMAKMPKVKMSHVYIQKEGAKSHNGSYSGYFFSGDSKNTISVFVDDIIDEGHTLDRIVRFVGDLDSVINYAIVYSIDGMTLDKKTKWKDIKFYASELA